MKQQNVSTARINNKTNSTHLLEKAKNEIVKTPREKWIFHLPALQFCFPIHRQSSATAEILFPLEDTSRAIVQVFSKTSNKKVTKINLSKNSIDS